MVSGCGGCQNQDAKSAAKKKAEKKKKKVRRPDFQNLDAAITPGIFPKPKEQDFNEDESKEERMRREEIELRERMAGNKTKLGHWVTVSFPLIANNFNSDGQLSAHSVDTLMKPVRIPGTDYFVSSSRPVSLPKAEWKYLESNVFLPRREIKTTIANINFRYESGGVSMLNVPPQTVRLLKPFQFHWVVLSKDPDSYKYVGLLNPVRIPETSIGETYEPFYNVIQCRPGDPVPLPRNSLCWTTIAYVLWDDFAPDDLDPDQQTALLDWLHHGGQLIISGPDSLDKLQSGFLADYLPAKFNSTYNLSNNDIAELNENWSVPVLKNPREKRDLVLSEKSPLLAVKLEAKSNGQFVPGTGELVVERRVGRGRIVATAFSLNDPPFRRWRSIESFYNSCLLRRPARRFGETTEGFPSFEWLEDTTSIFDPLVGSQLRYVSRDLAPEGTRRTHEYQTETSEDTIGFYGQLDTTPEVRFRLHQGKELTRNKENIWTYGGFNDDIQSGTAGWNDASGISSAARATLKDAAGISPPSSGFVLKLLAVYLIVLVPVNWLVFRLMGKVEWAWIAAPIIAIAGAISVVKLASLDIGFVRSNTQIGLVEAFANYPRAHTAEFSALYTSLSTSYDVKLDNPTAQSIPFSSNLGERFKSEQRLSEVRLRRSRYYRLEDFQVRSNFTGMTHTEYVADLQGSFSWDESNGELSLSNETKLNVDAVGLIRRESPENYRTCWIGELPANNNISDIQFGPLISRSELDERWSKLPEFASVERICRSIWEKQFGPNSGDRPQFVRDVLQIPELAAKGNAVETATKRHMRVNTMEELVNSMMDVEDMIEIYRRVAGTTTTNIGRMFDNVINQLDMEIGEVRMLGVTREPVGETQFQPKSTQTDRLTLVLVHLKKGELPPARRDENALADFTGNSNLDWLRKDETDLDETEE